MEQLNHWLDQIPPHGPWRWLAIFVLSVALLAVVKTGLVFIQGGLQKHADRTKRHFDRVLADCVAQTRWWALFIWIFYPMMNGLEENASWEKYLHVSFVILSSLQFGIWAFYGVAVWREGYLSRKVGSDPASTSAVSLLSTSLKGLAIVVIILICMSNLGINISALVTGLGIGGVAVALAAQNILGDMFASLSIVLDKPFVVGDYIAIDGDHQGSIENIGVKTTRVRSLTGEELVFSNKDILESRIHNYGRMLQRRVAFNISVPYSTPVEKLKQIPGWVQEFIKPKKALRFERSHLSAYGNSALVFETIYWVTNPDQIQFMDLQQELYLNILQKFAQEKISMALPEHKVQFSSLLKNEVESLAFTPSPGLQPGER